MRYEGRAGGRWEGIERRKESGRGERAAELGAADSGPNEMERNIEDTAM